LYLFPGTYWRFSFPPWLVPAAKAAGTNPSSLYLSPGTYWRFSFPPLGWCPRRKPRVDAPRQWPANINR
ncbi:MAG: hypothetical protein IKS20_07980, partial [Victivallales bacterium]|nr:hypothetical protein [Victivallales bacterium]